MRAVRGIGVAAVQVNGSWIMMTFGCTARLTCGGFMNMELEPGDTIVVPRKLDRFFWLKTTKDITQIVFQIAVAAGVVFAI